MKLISRRTRASGAASEWRAQYGRDQDGIAKRIEALGPSPEPDAVNAVIGNDTWTSCRCDECGHEVEFVVEVGEEPGYESSTATLCGECVRRAMAIVLGQEAK
jgi:hypothetical protein